MIAICTALKEALLAISINGKSSFKSLDSSAKHSENVMLSIDKMLDEMGENIKNNDEFAVVIGPGSFTGIRIGLALVKGLSTNTQTKVIPITTTSLMAFAYKKKNNPQNDFYCVMDALGGNFFINKFDKNGNRLEDDRMVDGEMLKNMEGDKVVLSEENLEGTSIRILPEDLLEFAQMQRENHCDQATITPLYIRKSQAEAALEEKMKKV